MDITFGEMLGQVAGLFLMLFIGFLLNRFHLLPQETENVLAGLSMKLLLPALQINTFMTKCTLENLNQYSIWILYGVLFVGLSMLLALLLTRPLNLENDYLTCVCRYCMVFANTGGFGIPIILALFGYDGLFVYQLFCLPQYVMNYIWGIGLLMPKENRESLRNRLGKIFNPCTISMLLGIVLGLTGIGNEMPEVINTTLKNLGGCYAVVSLLLVGFVIGKYNIREVIGDKLGYIMAAFRLLVIPGAFLLALRLLHAPDMLCMVTCLVYGCPCGMGPVVYPAACGQDTRPGANLILITSVLAVFTLPLLCSAI